MRASVVFIRRLVTVADQLAIHRMAHVKVKCKCDEPPQSPGFDEYVLVLKGEMVVDVGVGEEKKTVKATAGQTLFLPAGLRYHYHFPDACEYVPVCLPAFSPDIANREE